MVASALLPKPLFQEYEAPPVAVRLIEGVAQLICVEPVLLSIVATGAAISEVIVMLSVDEQPLLVAVTI